MKRGYDPQRPGRQTGKVRALKRRCPSGRCGFDSRPGHCSSLAFVNVVVVGGHGKIALRLMRILSERGDAPRGVIRDPGQEADLAEVGAEAIVCDIESEPLIEAVVGADAVVFAAGAGPGSGPERKQTVDLGGAVKLIDAAKANDVRRYVIVSSIGAHDPSVAEGDFRGYLQAKHDADEALIASGLDYTVVRPGSLTDDPGTGRVDLSTELGRRDEVPRDDVAAVIAETLIAGEAVGKVFELFAGDVPVAEAVRTL